MHREHSVAPRNESIPTRNERLEFILNSLVEGVLELDSSKQDVNVIKSDLVARGYDITEPKYNPDSDGVYHFHIMRKQNA